MAGRAGRRGIDTLGHVIHLTNLFKNMDQITTKTMLKGNPQTLVSKFKISYNLILNLIDVGETDYSKYVKRSMIQNDIDKTTHSYNILISKIQNELNNLSIVLNNSKTPFEIVEEYIQLKEKRLVSVNKQRKEIDRNILRIEDTYKTIINDVGPVTTYKTNKKELDQLLNEQFITERLIDNNILNVIELLNKDEYIILDNDNTKYKLTLKGHIATHIREIHCLAFTELILNNTLQNFEAKELVGILSCFTNVSVQEEKRAILPVSDYLNVKDCIDNIYIMYQKQSNIEFRNAIDTGFDYSMHFDLIDYSIKWCECNNDLECKQLLQQISLEKDIFLGEFVKAMLKINNIVCELEKIAELMGNMILLSTLKQVPQLTLKYVATNQSLYV